MTPRRSLAIMATWLLAALAAGPVVAASVTAEQAATPDGTRPFLLARPASQPAGRRPLVLLLHGHGGSAAQVLGRQRSAAPMSVWLPIADREGLLVAALDGSRAGDGQPGWADCRRDATGNPAVNDVAYAEAVVKRLVDAGEVDPARVYAMGMSNGAMMVLRLAQEMSPPLAGFAAVSGLMASDSLCQPATRAVPAMIVAGTDDPLVPIAGGQVHVGRSLRGGVLSANQTVEAWRGINQAGGAPRVSAVPATERDTRVERIAFGSQTGTARVLFLRVEGGGHVEPSTSQRIGRLYQRLVGPQNHDLEVAEEAWRFFVSR